MKRLLRTLWKVSVGHLDAELLPLLVMSGRWHGLHHGSVQVDSADADTAGARRLNLGSHFMTPDGFPTMMYLIYDLCKYVLSTQHGECALFKFQTTVNKFRRFMPIMEVP